jgi:fumarate hydratase class II
MDMLRLCGRAEGLGDDRTSFGVVAGRASKKIGELTQMPFRSHPNKFAALSAHDELVFASGALETCAGLLMKIANDVGWLASGPLFAKRAVSGTLQRGRDCVQWQPGEFLN